MKKNGLMVLLLLSMLLMAVSCGGDDEGDNNNNDGGIAQCDGDVCTLSGTITEDLTLTSDIQWVLRGMVAVGDDVNQTILTIEPGTTIYGESSTNGFLVITRHSKIMAEGTADAPIVFTSSKEVGSRSRGDWGGLIINGLAPVNGCEEEGVVCESFGEGGTGWYGGDDAADNSGVLRYVRVEFAGTIISPDNELNGIAFQGVGSGTTVEYIQVHMNKDDGVEFFGGTVNVKYALVTGPADDCFDWTDGWQGMAQFVVLQQYDDAGDQGIEADNNAEDNAATPRSKPTLSNFTIIGSPDSEASDLGMLLREGTGANISNFIVTGFNDACLDLDHTETFENAMSGDTLSGELTITNSILDCVTNFKMDNEKDEDDNAITDPFSVEDFYNDQDGNQLTDPQLADAMNQAAPDFSPASGSPALSGGQAPSDAFFTEASFIGAIGSDNDWTQGWTTHDQN